MQNCPLCNSQSTLFHQGANRIYRQCGTCSLVFVLKKYHLAADEEKRRYDNHENNPNDPRYRKFLSRLSDPLIPLLPQGATGLDFGCGPGPALAAMLEEAGFSVKLFDLYYANNPTVLLEAYDFVTCTETAEHFRKPREEWDLLAGLIKPGGILGIMTQQMTEPERFPKWHYIRDETHLCFYTPKTFKWIAKNYQLEILDRTKTTVIFRKAGESTQ
ncbi:MAG: class I SAM-dependent methyltransferase [Calditrichota bacterium]